MSSCLYCDGPLQRYPSHMSWSVCPKCEPGMFKRAAAGTSFYEQVLGHEMDMRGAPNR